MFKIETREDATTPERLLAQATANLQLVAVLEAVLGAAPQDAAYLMDAATETQALILAMTDARPGRRFDPDGRVRIRLRDCIDKARCMQQAQMQRADEAGVSKDARSMIALGLDRLAQACTRLHDELGLRELEPEIASITRPSATPGLAAG